MSKDIAVMALFGILVLGFFAFAIKHRAERQALCPGYSAYQACEAMGE